MISSSNSWILVDLKEEYLFYIIDFLYFSNLCLNYCSLFMKDCRKKVVAIHDQDWIFLSTSLPFFNLFYIKWTFIASFGYPSHHLRVDKSVKCIIFVYCPKKVFYCIKALSIIIKNPTIYNMIRWFAGTNDLLTKRLMSKRYFFL